MQHKVIRLAARPSKGIGPELFSIQQEVVPTPSAGQLLIKQTHMSLDPAMLGWMAEDKDSYIPPVGLGDVMRSTGLGEVVASEHADFAVGDRVLGMFGWQEYALSNGAGLNKVTAPLPAEAVLSILALPGLTATHGLFNVGKPKTGETIVVTGAAGSVGSIVGQLAKAEGLRVVGVAGSDDKCHWLRDELHFDGVINYKSENLADQLKALTPDGVDVYFENTGGPIQSLVYNRMNTFGRIVVCGMIADYLATQPAPGPSWIRMIKKRLTMQGFAMPDHLQDAPALIEKIIPYVSAGKIKYRAHVLQGLDAAVDGLNLLFTGRNNGKLMVEL